MKNSLFKRLIGIAAIITMIAAILICSTNNTKKLNTEQNSGTESTKIEFSEQYRKNTYALTDNEDNNSTHKITYEEADINKINNLVYIVDVISITDKVIYGDTATIDGYSGKIYIDTSGLFNADIETNKTYVIKTRSLIKFGDIPEVYAVDIKESTDKDLDELDNIRADISNYKECMLKYDGMEIPDIIKDANENYVYWTQDERNEFFTWITNKGYKDTCKETLKILIYNHISDNEYDNVVE